MKFMPNSLINAAIMRAVFGRKGFRPTLNLGNRIPGTAIATRKTNRTRVSQVGQRRGNRNSFGRPLEINRAEGGFKSVVTNGRLVPITVNTYGRLTYYHQADNVFLPLFQFESDNYTTSSNVLDVTNQVNGSDEFTENRRRSEEYRITNVCLSIDYNRVPQSGDRVSKLLMMTICDKLDLTLDKEMKRENNVMMLSMSSNGVKNYNTKLDARSTNIANLNWQNSNYTWPGVWQIKVSQQDITTLTRLNNESYITLGTWKLSVRILFRITDLQNLNITMSNPPNLTNLVKEVEELRKELEKYKSAINEKKESIVDLKKEEPKLLNPERLVKDDQPKRLLLTEQTTCSCLLPGQPGRTTKSGSSRTEVRPSTSDLLPGQPGRLKMDRNTTSTKMTQAEKMLRSIFEQDESDSGDQSQEELALKKTTDSPGLLDLLP